jgi:hypothetical protein
MNLNEFIKVAKPIVARLDEHAGSEGLEYVVYAKSGLKNLKVSEFEISETKSADGKQMGKLVFDFPHDAGFAESVVNENLPGIQDLTLELIF